MKKNTLALFVVFCLILSVLTLAACGKKDDGPTQNDTVISDENDVSETEPSEEEDTTEETQTIVYPTADGQAVKAYDVSFYLPESLSANEYNGMLGVYEFYTGDHSSSIPSGMDFNLMVSAESNTDGDLEAYARKTNSEKTGVDVDPEEVEINGSKWLKFTAGEGSVSFYATFNDGLYEIITSKGGDTQENYDEALKMLEDTLFLAIAQD